jgi:hypothetical protein
MKALILALVFSFSAIAGPVAYFPVGKSGANISYAEKGKCEEVEAQACYNVAICPLDYCELVTEITQDPDTGINIETKVLKEDPAKKSAYEAAQAAKELAVAQKAQAKALACQGLENSNIDSANTIAALKAIVKLMKECK